MAREWYVTVVRSAREDHGVPLAADLPGERHTSVAVDPLGSADVPLALGCPTGSALRTGEDDTDPGHTHENGG